jgi:hypothetical protein
MLEYDFNDDALRQRFLDYLSKQGVEHHEREDQDWHAVLVPEDLDPDAADAVEAYYHSLVRKHIQVFDADESSQTLDSAYELTVDRAVGGRLALTLNARLAEKVLGCLTADELRELAASIVAQAAAD